MIIIPQVSISTEKNLFLSKENFKISEIEFNDMDIFIKKYKNDSISNIQSFFQKNFLLITMSQIIHFLLKILDLIYLMLFMRTISTLFLLKKLKFYLIIFQFRMITI